MAGLVPAISFCPRSSCHRDEVIAHTLAVFHLMSGADALTENSLAEKFLATRDLCTGVQNECDLLNTCFADRSA
jgi:hypothetical protein